MNTWTSSTGITRTFFAAVVALAHQLATETQLEDPSAWTPG